MDKANLKGRSFLTLADFSKTEIEYLLDLSAKLKEKKKSGIFSPLLLDHKNIALIFEKTSTRTRCAFEVAAYDEGAHVTYIDPSSSQLNKKESVADTARVLARYYDAIEFRGYSQESVRILAEAGGIPVFNGLTDLDHPTQLLADLLTIREHSNKDLSAIKVVFAGDIRNNMALAWMIAASKLGFAYVGYSSADMSAQAKAFVEGSPELAGANISFSSDISCAAGADVIYTDVWASMGEEDLIPQRAQELAPFKVTRALMDATGNPNVLFMHCLPSFHDFETTTAAAWIEKGVDIREVDDDVFTSPNSVVFDEAENRLHTIKAVMVACMVDADAI